MSPLSLTIEGGPESSGSVTHNSRFALPSPQLPPAAPSGTDQHNEVKPVNEPPLRHEPRVCAGMCSCHIVDLDFIRPPPQKILVSVCVPGHPRCVGWVEGSVQVQSTSSAPTHPNHFFIDCALEIRTVDRNRPSPKG